MATKRLISSWRISETMAGRLIKILIVRDSISQKILFVFRCFCDRPTKWKHLRGTSPVSQTLAAPSRRWKLLLGPDDQPLVSQLSCFSTSSGGKVNRVRNGRNLKPAIRSKLRPRVRHRERVHSVGKWNPLWRSYAEKADLDRTKHILEIQFRWCKSGFSAILEDSSQRSR